MNCQNRYIFDTANQNDSRELLEILEESGFKSNISLTYTRRPDAYGSLLKEGDTVEIAVCRDTAAGKMPGFGVCSVNRMYLNGQPEDTGYLFSLRGRKEYVRKTPVLNRGYSFIFGILEKKGIKYFYTTILEDNIYAQKLLEKPRPFMPLYKSHGKYTVYTILTGRRRGNKKYGFEKLKMDDMGDYISFINNEGRKFNFFPLVTEELLMNNKLGFGIDDVYLLRNSNREIVAGGICWDQRSYKQYIVKGYGGILKILYPLGFLSKLAGYPALPKPDSVLNFFTLSFWAVKDNDREVFSLFLNMISSVKKDYSYFLVGIHDSNPLDEVFKHRNLLKYRSMLYLVSQNKVDIKDIDLKRPVYLECGRL